MNAFCPHIVMEIMYDFQGALSKNLFFHPDNIPGTINTAGVSGWKVRFFISTQLGFNSLNILYTGDNRTTQLLVAPSFKMVSIRKRCFREPVQMALGNVETRISFRYTGMHNRHIDILYPGGNTYSMRRNGLIGIAQRGATACLCGRNWRMSIVLEI